MPWCHALLIPSLSVHLNSIAPPLTPFQVAVPHNDLLRVGDAHAVCVGAVWRRLGLDPSHHHAVTVLHFEMHLRRVAAGQHRKVGRAQMNEG